MRKLVLAAVAAGVVPWSVAADDTRLAIMADLSKGDYSDAIQLALPLAANGDLASEMLLGSSYGAGRGVPQDYALAAAWFRKAANRGGADAQFLLGNYYYNGFGVPKDYAQAAA
jgi:hypothetical protein